MNVGTKAMGFGNGTIFNGTGLDFGLSKVKG